MAAHIIIDDLSTTITYTVGASSRTSFPVPFAYFETSNLIVTVGITVLTSADYTVSGTAVDAGFSSGTVVLDVGVTNTTVVIERVLPIERVTDFPNSGPLSIRALNTQFDKNTAIDQQLHAEIGSVDDDLQATKELWESVTGNETNVVSYASRAAAILATIAAETSYLRTAGYAAAGDGGGALYKKVVAEPAHAGKFQSADGAWWEISERLVDPRMYGAIASDNTKGTVNAAAFTAAMASGKRVYAEDGSTYYINGIVTPANAVGLVGKGTLIGLTPLSPNSAVLEINGVTNGFDLQGVRIEAPAGVAAPLYVFTADNVRIDSVTTTSLATGQGISMFGCSNVIVTRSHVESYGAYGILIIGCDDVKIIGNLVQGGIDAFNNGISTLSPGKRISFIGNTVIGATTFGYAMSQVDTGVIDGNISYGTHREGITIESGCVRITVSNNALYFNSATTVDAGITVVASTASAGYINIVGNNIYNPGANGIQLIDTGTGVEIVHTTVTGNRIFNPNENNNTGGAAYVGNGIALIGNVNNASIYGNDIRDTSGQMQYVVGEFPLLGDSPSGNQIGPNYGTVGALGRYLIIGVGSTGGYPGFVSLPFYTVAGVPSASITSALGGALIYITNEAGGAVPAFSDGTNWRRVTDRAVIS